MKGYGNSGLYESKGSEWDLIVFLTEVQQIGEQGASWHQASEQRVLS